MIKYKAEYYWAPKIVKVEIVRETKSSVVFNQKTFSGKDMSERKNTQYHQYFDTFKEAKAFLVKVYEKNVASARYNLEAEKSLLGTVKGMKDNDQD